MSIRRTFFFAVNYALFTHNRRTINALFLILFYHLDIITKEEHDKKMADVMENMNGLRKLQSQNLNKELS